MVVETIPVADPSARVVNVCNEPSVAKEAFAHVGHPAPTTTHPTFKVLPVCPSVGVISIPPPPSVAVTIVGAVNELAVADAREEHAMTVLSAVRYSAA